VLHIRQPTPRCGTGEMSPQNAYEDQWGSYVGKLGNREHAHKGLDKRLPHSGTWYKDTSLNTARPYVKETNLLISKSLPERQELG